MHQIKYSEYKHSVGDPDMVRGPGLSLSVGGAGSVGAGPGPGGTAGKSGRDEKAGTGEF